MASTDVLGRSPTLPWRRLTLHLMLLALVLAAVAFRSNLASSWTSDDGVYAVQAKLVRDHQRWDLPQRHPDADPDRRHNPLAHTTVTDAGRAYPYVKQPAWILAMAATSSVGGRVVGLHLPAYLGALGAAAVAWLLARRLSSGTESVAFWAVGLGGVLIEATALWAHTWAAALGGGLALSVVAASRGPLRWPALAGLAACCATAVLLRGEGVLAVVAVAVVLVVVGVARWRHQVGSWWDAIVPPAVAAGSGLGGFVLNRWWSAVLMDGQLASVRVDSLPTRGLIEGRLTGTLRTVVDGRGAVPSATLLALLAVGLAVAAGMELRSREGATRGVILSVVVVALVVLRSIVAEGDGAGLLVAMPLLAVGLGAWRWSTAGPAERWLAGFVVLDLTFVLATQYAEGGGAEWGGRYLFFALVPATCLTVSALGRGVLGGPADIGGSVGTSTARLTIGRGSRMAAVAVAVLVVVPTLTGLVVTGRSAEANDGLARRTARTEGKTVILLDRFVGRWGWRDLPEDDRLFAEPDEAGDLLERLLPSATGPVTVLGSDAETVRADGYERTVVARSEVVFTPTDG